MIDSVLLLVVIIGLLITIRTLPVENVRRNPQRDVRQAVLWSICVGAAGAVFALLFVWRNLISLVQVPFAGFIAAYLFVAGAILFVALSTAIVGGIGMAIFRCLRRLLARR